MTVITEAEFRERVDRYLGWMVDFENGCWRPRAVLGPGRSGAIAAVYVSHLLHVPFVPYGATLPDSMKDIMIVDAAVNSGRTLRKAAKKYERNWPRVQWFYQEPPRVKFWYEMWEVERAGGQEDASVGS